MRVVREMYIYPNTKHLKFIILKEGLCFTVFQRIEPSSIFVYNITFNNEHRDREKRVEVPNVQERM